LKDDSRERQRRSTFKDRFERFKENFDAGAPPYDAMPEVVATAHRITAELN